MKSHVADILNKISELEGPGSQKLKKSIIEEHLDVPEFVKVVEYALNPYRQYFTQSVPGLSQIKLSNKRQEAEKQRGHRDLFDHSPNKLPWKAQFASMFTLLDQLSSQQLPPNSTIARKAICDWASRCGPGTIEVFQRILRKDLKVGLGAKTFNKIKKGWVPQFEVQLAQPFNEKKLQFPCLVDPKFDGERCLAFIVTDDNETTVTYFSRNGLQFQNYGGFTNELISIFKGEGSLVVDCEAIHKLGFQAGQKIPKYHDPRFDFSHCQLAVFDWMTCEDFERHACNIEQKDRYQQLTKWFKHHHSDKVFLVDSRWAKSFTDVEKIFEHWIKLGLEGIIMKQPDGEYEFKRSYTWMKMKPTRSEDLRVVGFAVGDDQGRRAGKCGALKVVRNDPDHGEVLINVGSGLTDYMVDNIVESGDQILFTQPSGQVINLKGQIIEVVFDNITDDGSLRFPRFKRLGDNLIIRTDKI